jgi:hypothetical protein
MACLEESHVQFCQRKTRRPTLREWRLISAFALLLILFSTSFSAATTSTNPSSEIHRGVPRSMRVPAIDGDDIRFSRLSTAQGLSQTQANQIVQDDQGFIWFGTQYGLDRYDGYEFKVFTHDAAQENSLSCVYIHSLFKDRSGSLWVGCDQFLDRFDSLHETFTMGLAVPPLARLAFRPGHRQARNGRGLASCGLSPVLDREGAARPIWATGAFARDPRSDPPDVPGESRLGGTPHPRRAAQTRLRSSLVFRWLRQALRFVPRLVSRVDWRPVSAPRADRLPSAQSSIQR